MNTDKNKIDDEIKSFKEDYVLLQKSRIKPIYVFLSLGLVVGSFIGLILVSNREGEFEPSQAAGNT
jgi:hypothetical protein